MANMWNIIFGGTSLLALLAAIHQGLQWWNQEKCTPTCEADDDCVCVDEVKESVCEKDSLDERLNLLTKKIGKKASRHKTSKSKFPQKKNEKEIVQVVSHLDKETQLKYQEMLNGLRNNLKINEEDCNQLQDQIEWVTRRRTELKNEVIRGQGLYTQAVIKLAHGLRDIQKTARPSDGPDDGSTTNCTLPPLTGTGSELWAAFEKKNLPASAVPSKADGVKIMETVGTTPRAPAYYY